MFLTLSRRMFAALLFCASMSYAAPKPEQCSVCNRPLKAKYWTYEGQNCCSLECVDKLKPVCATCGHQINSQYMEAEGKKYCCKKCFDATLPRCEICESPIHDGYSIARHHYCAQCMKNSPTCFSCGLPAVDPTELHDGRILCSNCRRWEVSTDDMALKNYDRARRQLEAWTQLKISSVPELRLVDRAQMNALSGDLRKTDNPVSIRGLYSRQTTMVKRGIFGVWKTSPDESLETIYIIDHLYDETFRVAAVHELMHDLIHEHFPRLSKAPLWVHEGICQQAAAEYCRRRNYEDSLDCIVTCTDPDYGDGYRYINSLTGYGGWPSLKRWMETVDVESLPDAAPKP